jgi:hypothetical protein
MNKAQKCAWFNLIMAAILLVLLPTRMLSLPSRFLDGLALFFVFGVIVLFVLLFRKKQGVVEFDERDKLIHKRSLLVVYFVIWGFFITACIVPYLMFGPTGSIPVYIMPVILYGTFIVTMLVHSVLILVQYGRGGKDGQ